MVVDVSEPPGHPRRHSEISLRVRAPVSARSRSSCHFRPHLLHRQELPPGRIRLLLCEALRGIEVRWHYDRHRLSGFRTDTRAKDRLTLEQRLLTRDPPPRQLPKKNNNKHSKVLLAVKFKVNRMYNTICSDGK